MVFDKSKHLSRQRLIQRWVRRKFADLRNVPDRERAVTYIEASPIGLGLYLRHGWKACDDLVVDLRPHGGDHVAHLPFMVRQPSVDGAPEP